MSDRASDRDDVWDDSGLIHHQDHGCAVSYYTAQPAPTQWVAVGMAQPVQAAEAAEHGGRRLLVGAGRTEAEAIEAMTARCGSWNMTGESDS